MNKIYLNPIDVLFFRDGRPMEGSLSGYTMAWPTPDLIDHAFHAALHRAGFKDAHKHCRKSNGDRTNIRDRKFGSLLIVGPFPIKYANGVERWYFPRPADAQKNKSNTVTLMPVNPSDYGISDWQKYSSLPKPLKYAVGNSQPPSKNNLEQWISKEAFEHYLDNDELTDDKTPPHFLNDNDIADKEETIGIAIDPDTQTTGTEEVKGQIYTAHYLRLREDVKIGVYAVAMDKINDDPNNKQDLIKLLIKDNPTRIVVGGQQRLCTAQRFDVNGEGISMPVGLSDKFNSVEIDGKTRWLVKWVLLTPAIYPEIKENPQKQIKAHPGGWLPNWICPETGKVLLKSGDTERKQGESREDWRRRIRNLPDIEARLVAAIVPKPIAITGWALPENLDAEDSDPPFCRTTGGAKSTHLAVPAGAVYYFTADTEYDAKELAAALNWHGNTKGKRIVNRRSTLLGEKGYGLGVCGSWEFFKKTSNNPDKNR